MTKETKKEGASDNSIEPLLEEYRHLFAYANSNALTLLKIPPAFLAVVTGIIIYKDQIPQLFGLTVSLALFTMLVWIGYCHSMVNGLGLRLVEIEQQINRSLNLRKDFRLSFHTKYIADGSKILPGFHFYSKIIFLILACVLLGGLYHFWLTMSAWGWSFWIKSSIVVILIALNLAPLINMILAERRTVIEKLQILSSQ